MNFKEKIIESEGGPVRLITAIEEGDQAWYLLKINPNSYASYKKALKSGNCNIAEFGKILSSGWGNPPPIEAIKKAVASYL